MEKIFIIGPVRNMDAATQAAIARHVAGLEAEGHMVHWPKRDTNQDDPIGLRICQDNREAIYQSSQVHIWFDDGSQGSVFDLGMLFYFFKDARKKVVVINEREVWPRGRMIFEDVLLELDVAPSGLRREGIFRSKEIFIDLDTRIKDCLFFIGMVFASLRNESKRVVLTNRDQISRTPHKSFENVFLELAEAS